MASVTGQATRARVPEGARRCRTCDKVKPLVDFYRRPAGRRESTCRTCRRLANARRMQGEAYRAWRAAYEARPDVRAKARGQELGYYRRLTVAARERRKARWRARAATPRGKIVRRCGDLRRHLRRADLTPAGRARWEAELALCAAELARIDGRGLVPC
jgi:hypothetical protein